MNSSAHIKDRALGAIIASAAGDALGAPYEFKPPVAADKPIGMTGGGSFNWAPGEWTDDTSMAMVILQQLAAGKSLGDESTLDEVVQGWRDWARTAPDVGLQTRAVLGSLNPVSAAGAREAAKDHHERKGRSGGNGSLMRTGPVVLSSLDSAEQTATNARAVSDLTHFDSEAGDACVLWCLAARQAILTGELDIRIGLPFLPADVQDRWLALIAEAEAHEPTYFANNGWVIHAFQAAWSAIHSVEQLDEAGFRFKAQRLAAGLEAAVRAGFDTDTVAAIAGILLGAKYGASAVPASWRRLLHGWPTIDVQQLSAMCQLALNNGEPDGSGWPGVEFFDYRTSPDRFELVQHPHDSGVWLGGVASLQNLPTSVTAVVSLCRIGTHEVPARIDEHIEVLLIDSSNPSANLNLEFMFTDTAAAIKELRDQGHEVFLHCVQSQSRTPSVAITYSVEHLGVPLAEAKSAIKRALPMSAMNSLFERTIEQLLS